MELNLFFELLKSALLQGNMHELNNNLESLESSILKQLYQSDPLEEKVSISVSNSTLCASPKQL
jgi:hypothetical protein